jgi:hypothetical protein
MNPRRGFSRRHLIKAAAGTAALGALTATDLGRGPAGQALLNLAQAAEVPDLSRDQVVATLPTGTGPGQVGIHPVLPSGPQALVI